MTNKTAIKEIKEIQKSYLRLWNNYYSLPEQEKKDVDEKREGIFRKIGALETAIVAMNHIETISKV
jgi:hypothetical protein